MLKPNVFVSMQGVPITAINLLCERWVTIAYTQKLSILLIFVIFIYSRFNVKISDFKQTTRKEILESVPGSFAIFCTVPTKIDEEVIKAAGKLLYNITSIKGTFKYINSVIIHPVKYNFFKY